MKNKRWKNDILLIAALLILAGIGLLALHFLQKPGATVEVQHDGVTERWPLSENREMQFFDGEESNTLVIQNGRVCMSEANCPDKICVNTGWIENAGETIVCLPHKIVVSIVGENGYDAVAD